MSDTDNDDKPAKKKAVAIISPEALGSYVTLVRPRAIEKGKEPKYSINLVLKKKDPEVIKFIKRLEASFTASMINTLGKALPFSACKHYPIWDGDKPNEDGEVSDITKRCWIVYASSKFKPGAIDKRGNKLISEDQLYSGAIYRASLSTWAWKHKTGGKGVSINLDNIMKVRDGDRIGGGRAAESDFENIIDPDAEDDEDGDNDPMMG